MIQPYMTSRTKKREKSLTRQLNGFTKKKKRKSELINDKCVDMYSWLTFPSWTTRLFLFISCLRLEKVKDFWFAI